MIRLFHRDFGGAGLPKLVVLHGMLGSSRNWQTVARDLTLTHHVLAPDLRNHGESPHAEPMTYEAMLDDLIGWLDDNQIGPCTVLGHSMGGKLAMLLACRHPARVTQVLVVDIAPRDYYWPGHRQTFTAMNELNLADLKSRAEAEIRMEGRVPNWGLRKFILTNLERTNEGRWHWQINLPVLTAALPTLERNPLRAEDRYAGPVHVIAGGKSNYVEPEDHAAIRAHFPASQVTVLAESGHNPHMEARAAFVAEFQRAVRQP